MSALIDALVECITPLIRSYYSLWHHPLIGSYYSLWHHPLIRSWYSLCQHPLDRFYYSFWYHPLIRFYYSLWKHPLFSGTPLCAPWPGLLRLARPVLIMVPGGHVVYRKGWHPTLSQGSSVFPYPAWIFPQEILLGGSQKVRLGHQWTPR